MPVCTSSFEEKHAKLALAALAVREMHVAAKLMPQANPDQTMRWVYLFNPYLKTVSNCVPAQRKFPPSAIDHFGSRFVDIYANRTHLLHGSPQHNVLSCMHLNLSDFFGWMRIDAWFSLVCLGRV